MKPRRLPMKRTRLARSTRLRGAGELKSGGPVKARRRTSREERLAEGLARITVWARASQPHGYALCELCGERPPREYQHRKAKAHCTAKERWAPSNGLAVCGHGNLDGCHGRIHQHPTEAYANGWSVRSTLDPKQTPCLRRGVLVWLNDAGDATPLDLFEIREWVGAA